MTTWRQPDAPQPVMTSPSHIFGFTTVIVAALAVSTGVAHAQVLDSGTGLVTVGGSARWRAEGSRHSGGTYFDTRGLTAPRHRWMHGRTRLFVEVGAHEAVSALVELQHARTWVNDRQALEDSDQLDLARAWIELRTPVSGEWSVRLGRFRVPAFGDERIMSTDPWDNVGRALDGVQVVWAPHDWRLVLLAANTSESAPLSWSPGYGNDYWFGGAALEMRTIKSLDVDFYAFARHFNRAFGSERATEPDTGRKVDVTLGLRAAWHAGPVRLTAEVYGQLGRQGPDTISAWAAAERIEWRVLDNGFAPTVFFEHAFASGDKRPTDGRINTFDPLFPDRHRHLGPSDYLGFRNTNSLEAGFSVGLGGLATALDGWTFTFVARDTFLASQNDAWYGADGEPVTPDPAGEPAGGRALDGELSGWIEGELADGAVSMSLGLAHWCPNTAARDLRLDLHSIRIWFSTEVRF